MDLPCIVNTKWINTSDEVVLKVDARDREKKEKDTKARTAFDQLADVDAKKRKLSKNTKGGN